MKKAWIHKIYSYICSNYLKKNPEKIDILEHILFLIQIESLTKFGKPFYKYKTFINKGNIRIPYLSDLLRVSPVETLLRDRIIGDRSIDKYVKIFKKYGKMSDDEIFNRVSSILENEVYSIYYKEAIYSSEYLRTRARLKINIDTCTIMKFIIHLIVTLTACGSIIALFSGIYLLLFFKDQMLIQMSDFLNVIYILIILVFVSSVAYGVWTWIWTRPNKFEIENNYLHD